VKFSIVTFGCRVNQADSLEVEEQLRARGGVPDAVERADVVVVNTCSVTATADQGARQTIRRIARDNPSARIVVTGCYATRAPDAVRALPLVSRLVANAEKATVCDHVCDVMGLTTADRFADGDGACGLAIEPGMMGRTAYTLRVQTGCEESCTYCIIPSTRGRSRSRTLDEVVLEAARAADAGFREVALTGVHLGSYGRDLRPPASLAALLDRLSTSVRGVLFRISSLEPMDCTPVILERVAAPGPFAPHFHLPLQHASDRILAAMRRPYTLDEFRRLVDGIRARLPHASIGSDVIVGFPGETDADFDAAAGYLRRSPLTHLHVFPYSDRPGTFASRLPQKVDGATIRSRAAAVRGIGAALTERFHATQVGTIRPGLTIDDGALVVTDNYLKVRIAPGLDRNTPVRVRIDSHANGLAGTVLT
jgi:threonylcarbamoyladenosine tRNA methylthiotransferase MtaB